MHESTGRRYACALETDGTFTIDNYSRYPVFSSFLPGIADVWGIPLWVFYCNRGQGIACFGTDTKDRSILEFQSASRAYQTVPVTGFRTFLKLDGGDCAEPFARPAAAQGQTVLQCMDIRAHALALSEDNRETGIRTDISYFTLPNADIGALVRVVTLTNTSDRCREIELLDGLPAVTNAGVDNFMLKNMPYLAEAWSDVEGVETHAPLYKIRIATDDTPEVRIVREGNFYVSKAFGADGLAPVVVDSRLVFGSDEAFLSPEAFFEADALAVPESQCARKGIPCAFAHYRVTLAPSESFRFASFAGRVRDRAQLDAFLANLDDVAAYVSAKETENRRVIARIQDDVLTVSADKRFDGYTRQNYLDNVLRGGLPCQVGPKGQEALFYLFSRKHGDMERDYNWFRTAPTRFSQGNGNYRDVNQNRRNDVLIHPFVEDAAIRTFVNLLQLDGNNPLDVQGARFFIGDAVACDAFLSRVAPDAPEAVRAALHGGFTPGELLEAVESTQIVLRVPSEAFVAEAVALSERFESARHGEGYWTDHWTYNTDLIERFLAVYPERGLALYFGDRSYTFQDTFCFVTPRSGKHVLTPLGVRQYGAVSEDKARHRMLEARTRQPYAVRTRYGEGEVYRTTLFAKLAVLVLNKAAALDPSGVGIEMESNKPNWYDALNALPGLFGSSSNETAELVRLMDMLRETLSWPGSPDAISLPVEAAEFLSALSEAFDIREPFSQWEARCAARDAYRARIAAGVDGAETDLATAGLRAFFDQVAGMIAENRGKGIDPDTGLPCTYFIHEATQWTETGETRDGQPLVRVTAFRMRPLPLFLEGVVHAMRCEPNPEAVLAMHRAVLESPLYDHKLHMFKVNAPLDGEGFEIGRCRVFPSGWLENESIWLHMSYKYLLELARKGLFEAFHEAAGTSLVCNLDPHVYGRSILENASFICSSAFYDESRHGRGYYARLSGSTAEFVHMWLLMVIGGRPFRLRAPASADAGSGQPKTPAAVDALATVSHADAPECGSGLELVFEPAIPGTMFTRAAERTSYLGEDGMSTALDVPENAFAFRFLGRIPVVYLNPRRLDTWTPEARITRIRLLDRDGALLHDVDGNRISHGWAERIRARDAMIGRVEASIGDV